MSNSKQEPDLSFYHRGGGGAFFPGEHLKYFSFDYFVGALVEEGLTVHPPPP